MRVINLMLGKRQGGLEAMALVYHKLLQSRSVEVMTLAASGSWLSQKQSEIQPFLTTKIPPAIPYFSRREIERAVRGFNADLIIAHGTRAITLALGIKGVKHIGIIHNTRFKKIFASLDLMIAVSSGVSAKAQKEFPNQSIEIVPNHVTLPKTLPIKTSRQPLVFGTMGRHHINKGFDIFLDALADARLRDCEWQAVIAGEGPETDRLRRLASHHRLNDRVNFSGWVDDVKSFYESIDVFVLPSREEPFGLVLLEAIAAGVPILATNTDGPIDILRMPSMGLMVERDNPVALAGAMIELIEGKHDLKLLREQAFQEITKTYNFETIAERLHMALTKAVQS